MRLFVLVAALAAMALPAFSQDAPHDAAPATEVLAADLLAAAINFERDCTVAVYERQGRRNPEWDEGAIEVLDAASRWLAKAPGALTDKELWRRSARLTQNRNCDDPLILTINAVTMQRASNVASKTTLDILQRAAEGLAAPGYAPHWRALVQFAIGDNETRGGNGPAAAAAYASAAEAMAESFVAHANNEPVVRHLYALIADRLGRDAPLACGEAIINRLQNDPAIDPWIVLAALGEWHVRLAWDARGSGWAYTVTDEGWRGFRDNLVIAAQRFKSAYRIAPHRPEAPARMIAVAMAGHAGPGETEQFWFDRATAAQFDYWPAYSAMLWALRPRWGGSHEAMLEFGRRCAATDRYDTRVPTVLVSALRAISRELPEPSEIWGRPGIYAEAAEVLRRSAEHPAHGRSKITLMGQLAAMAWHAGEYEDLRRAMDEHLNGYQTVGVVTTMGAFLERLRSDAYLATGSLRDAAIAATAKAGEGDWTGALEVLDGATRDHRRHEPYLDDARAYRRAILSLMSRMSAGGWAPIEHDAKLNGWCRVNGYWNSYSSGKFGGRPANEGMELILDAPLGRRFEVRATIDFTHERLAEVSNGGFLFNYRRASSGPRFVSVRFIAGRDAVMIGGNYSNEARVELPPALAGPEPLKRVDLAVAIWDDHLLIRVNDHPVYSGRVEALASWAPSGLFGLCGYYTWESQGHVFYEDLRVRRLDAPPPELKFEKAPEEQGEPLPDLLPDGEFL